jgi:hypothetical protein
MFDRTSRLKLFMPFNTSKRIDATFSEERRGSAARNFEEKGITTTTITVIMPASLILISKSTPPTQPLEESHPRPKTASAAMDLKLMVVLHELNHWQFSTKLLQPNTYMIKMPFSFLSHTHTPKKNDSSHCQLATLIKQSGSCHCTFLPTVVFAPPRQLYTIK